VEFILDPGTDPHVSYIKYCIFNPALTTSIDQIHANQNSTLGEVHSEAWWQHYCEQ